MQRTLKWDAELDLPTMTSYIEQNDEYKRIMRRIGRARTIDQALKKLERFYGKFRMMETVLERDLEKLPNNPTSLKQETENCEQILNFIEDMENNGKESEINHKFIMKFQKKLSKHNRLKIADSEGSGVEIDREKFTELLWNIVGANQYRLCGGEPDTVRDPPPRTERRKYHQHNSVEVEPESEASTGGTHKSCWACGDTTHRIFKCGIVSRKNVTVKDKTEMLKKKGVCSQCLLKHDSGVQCSDKNKGFRCNSHGGCNVLLCGCKPVKKSVTVSVTLADGDNDNDNEVCDENDSTKLNGTAVGCVSFMNELVQFIDSAGDIREEMLCYDGLATHTSGDEKKIDQLTNQSTPLGRIGVKTYQIGRAHV